MGMSAQDLAAVDEAKALAVLSGALAIPYSKQTLSFSCLQCWRGTLEGHSAHQRTSLGSGGEGQASLPFSDEAMDLA